MLRPSSYGPSAVMENAIIKADGMKSTLPQKQQRKNKGPKKHLQRKRPSCWPSLGKGLPKRYKTKQSNLQGTGKSDISQRVGGSQLIPQNTRGSVGVEKRGGDTMHARSNDRRGRVIAINYWEEVSVTTCKEMLRPNWETECRGEILPKRKTHLNTVLTKGKMIKAKC